MELDVYLLCLYIIIFKQEKIMKNYLLPLVFATFFTSSVYADSEMKIKDIKTVEDVKEYRAMVINKMTDRLNSGDLTEERANLLEKRIAKLESKPLPTQEQINWRLANPIKRRR